MQLKRISYLLIFLTLLLMVLGSIVQMTNSGLACTTWPLCSENLSSLSYQVSLKMAHRVLASIIFVLHLFFLIYSFKFRAKFPAFYKYNIFSFLLIIAQSLLGALAVIYKLPTNISIFHFVLASSYVVATFMGIQHLRSLVPDEVEYEEKVWPAWTKHGILTLFFLLCLQGISGAFFKHLGAHDFCKPIGFLGLCAGSENILSSGLEQQVNIFHKFFGGLVFIFSSVLILKTLKALRCYKNIVINNSLWLLLSALSVQVILGPISYLYKDLSLIKILHLIFGIISILATLNAWKKIQQFEYINFKKNIPSFFSDLISLTKPRLTLLVLVTAFVGMLVAPIRVDWVSSLSFLLFLSFIVASACAFNCVMEIEVDKKMERTNDRPLPMGRLKVKEANIFAGILFIVGAVGLFVFTPFQSALLSIVSMALYLFAYTPMKQKSALALYVGAIPGALPPLLGHIASMGEVKLEGLILFLIVFVWQLPHFLAIAIFYEKDYKNAEIKTFVYESGVVKATWGIILYTILLVLVAWLPIYLGYFGKHYSYFSLALNIPFLLLALIAYLKRHSDQVVLWARRYFWASIIYLPLLFIGMIILR